MTHTIKHPPQSLIECLAQADVWQDAGTWRPIDGMPISRALSLLGGLERRAATLAILQTIENEEALQDLLLGKVLDLEQVPYAESEVEEENREILADPRGWLRNRPFYRALLRRIEDELGQVFAPNRLRHAVANAVDDLDTDVHPHYVRDTLIEALR